MSGQKIPMTEQEVGKLSMLALAHVGDAVFELLVRSRLCREWLENGAGTAEK